MGDFFLCSDLEMVFFLVCGFVIFRVLLFVWLRLGVFRFKVVGKEESSEKVYFFFKGFGVEGIVFVYMV